MRDLPADIIKALKKYDIDFFLYFTGDGPYASEELNPDLLIGNPQKPVTEPFVQKWAEVMQEYAERYGTDVKGWWIDGCWFGYNDELMGYYHRAAKAGNPDSMIATNVRGTTRYGVGLSTEEYVAGERNDFDMLPVSRIVDGAQSHILAPIGILPDGVEAYGGWAHCGTVRTKEYMLDYIKKANAIGTPVTVDMQVYRDGSFNEEQQALLEWVGKRL